MQRFYDDPRWKEISERVRERDGECLFHAFGNCTEDLHAHHIDPVALAQGDPLDEERCVSVCSHHHPILEAVQRRTLRWRTCPHDHRYPGARAECERRLNGLPPERVAA